MTQRSLNMAFVSDSDPNDTRNWSGTPTSILKALEQANGTVSPIGPLQHNITIPHKIKWHAYSKLFNQLYWWTMEPALLKDLSRQASERLASIPGLELIFGPGHHSSPLTYLSSDKPMVFWGDATFKLLLDTYSFAGPAFCKENIRHGHENHQELLNRCALAVYASRWAADSAINDYGVDPQKVLVLPFGPNLQPGYNQEGVEKIIDARTRDACRLLFVGVDWNRKRADLAIDVARTLNAQGLPTELTIVGCAAPPDRSLPEFVNVIGVVNTSDSDGKALLSTLFGESHFFLMPSKAEAFGIVFVEANEFGVPSISCRVGGIPSAITDGVNGKLFAPQAEADEYARYIFSALSNWTAYREFCLTSFNEARNRLSWSINAGTLLERMRLLI